MTRQGEHRKAVRTELDDLLRDLLTPVGLTVGALLAFFGVAFLTFVPDHVPLRMDLWWWGGAALFAAVAVLARSGRIPSAQSHTVFFGLAVFASLLCATLVAQGGPLLSGAFLLVLIAASVLMLSLPWYTAAAAVVCATWGIVATGMQPTEWAPWLILVVSSAIIGGLAQWVRVRTYRHLFTLEQARQASHRVLEEGRKVIDSSSEAIVSTDLQGVVTSWNPAAERIFGYPPSEALGMPLDHLFAGQDQTRVAHILGRVREGAAVPQMRIGSRTRSGGSILIEMTIFPVRDQGRVVGLSAISRDLTEDRRRERERSAIWDLSIDLFAIIAPDGHFRDVSPRWEDVLGRPRAELLRRPYLELVHPDDQEETVRAFDRLVQEGHTTRFSNRYRHQDGSYRTLVWSANWDTHSGVAYAVARDVTEEMESERERQEERERALELERRHAMDALKTDFIKHAAHELITPLTPVVMQTDVLMTLAGRRGDGQLTRLAGVLDRNVERLNQIIQDLLTVTQNEAGQVAFDPGRVEVGTLLGEVTVALAPHAEAKRVRIETRFQRTRSTFRGDARRMGTAVRRVTENAVRFAPEGSAVELATREEGDGIRFEVADRGPGVPEERSDALFTAFGRAHDPEMRTDLGVGLGLYLARMHVEAHGGRIGYEPRPGGGALFWMWIPYEGPPTDRPGPVTGRAAHRDVAAHAVATLPTSSSSSPASSR